MLCLLFAISGYTFGPSHCFSRQILNSTHALARATPRFPYSHGNLTHPGTQVWGAPPPPAPTKQIADTATLE